MNDLTRLLFFLRLISVGEIATWVFLHWKGRAQFLNLSLFMDVSNQNRISRWQTAGRLLCGKLQWWNLHRDGHIFVRTFSVGLKLYCYGGWGWGGGAGGIRTCTTCCLRDMETLKPSSTNQNCCKCLREALTNYNDYKGNIWKGAWS